MDLIVHRFNDKHPDVLVTDLWRIGECEACDYRTEIKGYGDSHEKRIWFCKVCASTSIATAHRYAHLAEYRTVLSAVGWCTNKILDAIKQQGEQK